jgi:hypothetical protein
LPFNKLTSFESKNRCSNNNIRYHKNDHCGNDTKRSYYYAGGANENGGKPNGFVKAVPHFAWTEVNKVKKDNADDAYCYAKQLWCEDKAKWVQGKRKMLRGDWTVEHFDQEMEKLKKQEPVWEVLIKKVDGMHEKLEDPQNA